MALWMIRAGSRGEHEQKFLSDDKVYLTWDRLNYDLGKLKSQEDLNQLLRKVYPGASPGKLRSHTGQIWAFSHKIRLKDWAAIPSKSKPAIHIIEIASDYQYDRSAKNPYFHYRSVNWIAKDIPRSIFDQDLLYSFGAFMTICEVKRNDAEKRVKAMAAKGWKPLGPASATFSGESESDDELDDGEVDLELLARDQVAKLIAQKFKGHELSRLVAAILRAQGYITFVSPEGPDKGVDILAAPGPLGFGHPRICVQVKSGDSPVDTPVLNQLIGSMRNVNAEQGLMVSWGGFKTSVDREVPAQFFSVRMWDQADLIRELLANHDKLEEEFRTELPLKRIWTVSLPEEAD